MDDEAENAEEVVVVGLFAFKDGEVDHEACAFCVVLFVGCCRRGGRVGVWGWSWWMLRMLRVLWMLWMRWMTWLCERFRMSLRKVPCPQYSNISTKQMPLMMPTFNNTMATTTITKLIILLSRHIDLTPSPWRNQHQHQYDTILKKRIKQWIPKSKHLKLLCMFPHW